MAQLHRFAIQLQAILLYSYLGEQFISLSGIFRFHSG